MDKIYANMDLEAYQEGEGIDLILEGWRASPDQESIDIQGLADGGSVPLAK